MSRTWKTNPYRITQDMKTAKGQHAPKSLRELSRRQERRIADEAIRKDEDPPVIKRKDAWEWF